MIKIHVLAENTACSAKYGCEHGVSLYMVTDRHNILFDSGQSNLLIHQAALLGADLGKVDLAVLSHGHYDHGGGLEGFLEVNKTAPVYLHKTAFGAYYNQAGQYIGLSPTLKESDRLVYTGDEVKIDDEVTLCTCAGQKAVYPIERAGLQVKTARGLSSDLFTHEQYLVLNDHGRKIVCSGCAHKGVLNIMHWLKPDVFIGGFHFMKEDISRPNDRLDHAAAALLAFDALYYTCHCTGRPQYLYLKERMGDRLRYISAGETVTL